MKYGWIWLFMGLGIVLLLAGILWLLGGLEGEEPAKVRPPASEPSVSRAGEGLGGKAEALLRPGEEGVPRPGPGESREALSAQGLRISGRVVDLLEGGPIEGARVSLIRRYAIHDPSSLDAAMATRTGPEGRFTLPVPAVGVYTVKARAPGYAPGALKNVEAAPGKAITGLTIRLDPGLQVSGQVVEEATGYPVAGVLVTTTMESRILGSMDTRGEALCTCARTDEEGRFLLQGIDPRDREVSLAALHPDFAEAILRTRPGDRSAVIRLVRGHAIHGRVLDDGGSPAPGIEITLRGPGIPVERRVFTGPEGSYVTPPIAPGRVEVSAALPERPRGSSARPRFSPEMKTVEMQDRDLEVNFGPDPDTVTWRGTLLDAGGKPVPRARISLRADASDETGSSLIRHVRCDEKGCFELGKLPLGRFLVHASVPAASFETILSPVTLDRPGVVEKDLHLPGGSIRGAVLLAPSNEPVPFGEVRAKWHPSDRMGAVRGFGAIRTPVDGEGRFAFKGLRPGRYTLFFVGGSYFFSVPGYRDACTFEGPGFSEGNTVVLRGDETVDGLRIVLQPTGRVRIEGTGFSPMEAERFEARFIRPGYKASFNADRYHTDGTFTRECRLRPGPWEVQLFLGEDSPAVVRRITVEPEGLTEIRVDRKSFPFSGNFTTVTGTVRFTDGRPAQGTRVRFLGCAPTEFGIYPAYRAVCDTSGRYTLARIPPGTWEISLSGFTTPGAESTYRLPDLVISETPPEITPLDLEIPLGTVRGTLLDARQGQPLSAHGECRLRLLDAEARRPVLEQEVPPGARFELHGVPSGTFLVKVRAEGFLELATAPFTYQGPQPLDLGKVSLTPAAVLVVEARDLEGNPVDGPLFLDFPTDRASGESLYLAPGRVRYCLAPGVITASARVPGYRPRTFTVVVEGGKTVTVKVVLEREP